MLQKGCWHFVAVDRGEDCIVVGAAAGKTDAGLRFLKEHHVSDRAVSVGTFLPLDEQGSAHFILCDFCWRRSTGDYRDHQVDAPDQRDDDSHCDEYGERFHFRHQFLLNIYVIIIT